MTNSTNPNDCHCAECAEAHAEFIGRFGRWPSMSHAATVALTERRNANAESYDRMVYAYL